MVAIGLLPIKRRSIRVGWKRLPWAVQGCTDMELKKLFRDNAALFYRLDD